MGPWWMGGLVWGIGMTAGLSLVGAPGEPQEASPCIEVRVFDEQGRLLESDSYELWDLSAQGEDSHLPRCRVEAVPRVGAVERFWLRTPALPFQRSGPARRRRVFHPPADDDYHVLVQAAGQATQIRTVHLARSSLVLDFILDQPREQGTLEVSVHTPAGDRHAGGFEVVLLDPETEVVLEREPTLHARGPRPVLFQVPAGHYLVRVEELPLHAWHGQVRSRVSFGGFEGAVHVPAGRVETLTATLTRPSRVELELRGTAGAREAEAVRPGRDGLRYLQPPEVRANYAEITLWRTEGRSPRAVHFAYEFRASSWSAGTHLRTGLALGQRSLSEPLAPGRYLLVATLPGGRYVTRSIELRSDEALPVLLDFGD